ncbi:hypothetical protein [Streptomyces roseoverticillatus]|uniref:Uncharacterized protein n=1 Tax=Streptomyces roseoverticillatus TaxID=66429 RepID=A0ABV3J509_9ACTN
MPAQSAMVVNEPDVSVPWTRTIQTKWALGHLHGRPGTLVAREYPGAPAKHYPVPDSAGANHTRQDTYAALLTAHTRNPLFAAGRLRHLQLHQHGPGRAPEPGSGPPDAGSPG